LLSSGKERKSRGDRKADNHNLQKEDEISGNIHIHLEWHL
jgi:hypothetical protein